MSWDGTAVIYGGQMGDEQRERDGREKRWREIVRAGLAKAMKRLEELGERGFGEVTVSAAKTGNKWEISQTLRERAED